MSVFKLFVNHHKKDSFVNRIRQKRFAAQQQHIERLLEQKESIKILDIGGEIDFWKHMGWQNERCTIYLLNLEDRIAASSGDNNGFVWVQGNALNLPFNAGDFDVVFSNSVIEHVGSYQNQALFASEVNRVCSKYIIQTPSLWFPLEPHSLLPLFQFLPHSFRALLIMTFNINYFPKATTYKAAIIVSHSTLMFTHKRFKQLFPEAEIQVERFLGIPKSYTAIKL